MPQHSESTPLSYQSAPNKQHRKQLQIAAQPVHNGLPALVHSEGANDTLQSNAQVLGQSSEKGHLPLHARIPTWQRQHILTERESSRGTAYIQRLLPTPRMTAIQAKKIDHEKQQDSVRLYAEEVVDAWNDRLADYWSSPV